MLFHGSTGSRLFRLLAAGQPTCLTVTLLDGLVLARSAFESSMNYRSAMVLGVARRIEGDDELDALRTISEHLLPGRWDEVRPPQPKERAATLTLALDLAESSVKVSTGGPDDDPADLRRSRPHAPVGRARAPRRSRSASRCRTTCARPGHPFPTTSDAWRRA